MQVGGVGGGVDGHNTSHHVTGCLHEHNISQKEPGGMKLSSAANMPGANTGADAVKELSLVDLLRDVVSTGKRLLGRIWGEGAEGTGSGAAVNGNGGEQMTSASEQVIAQISEADLAAQAGMSGNSAQGDAYNQAETPDAAVVKHHPRVAAAATAVQAPQSMIQNNPYFTTSSDPGKVKESIFQKIRVKFRDVVKQFAQRFTGAFTKNNSMDFRQSSLNSRQKQPKEDLRKHSRYRDKDIEIDCVLTDDSYLMDSYDRKGEYSKLTTEK